MSQKLRRPAPSRRRQRMCCSRRQAAEGENSPCPLLIPTRLRSERSRRLRTNYRFSGRRHAPSRKDARSPCSIIRPIKWRRILPQIPSKPRRGEPSNKPPANLASAVPTFRPASLCSFTAAWCRTFTRYGVADLGMLAERAFDYLKVRPKGASRVRCETVPL